MNNSYSLLLLLMQSFTNNKSAPHAKSKLVFGNLMVVHKSNNLHHKPPPPQCKLLRHYPHTVPSTKLNTENTLLLKEYMRPRRRRNNQHLYHQHNYEIAQNYSVYTQTYYNKAH